MCACRWYVVCSVFVVHMMCVCVYECMFLCMSPGVHMQWHMCGSEGTALGISPHLSSWLEAVSLRL